MPGVVARGQPQQTQGRLIKPATWEIPAHPLKTLYRSQEIQGELLHPVHSDLPGQLHIRTTIPTFDKFGYGTILLDKGSLIIAVQTGQPQYGQSRLKIVLEQIELPTGEVMALKASIDEQDGSSGLAGKVNNHYGKLLLATGISALLNIGVRSAAGTPGAQQFFRNPVQDAAQDVGQGVQQEAQKAVDRELRVPPTIERKAYTFCTIHLQQNIQFNRPPVVAR
jgi:type IV secretion system protein VirB10